MIYIVLMDYLIWHFCDLAVLIKSATTLPTMPRDMVMTSLTWQMWIRANVNHPSYIKLPIVQVLGGAHLDYALEACRRNYYLWRLIIDVLLYYIAKPENNNILQSILFLHLTSIEMIAQLQLGAILFMLIIIPMWWLSANTHLLGHCLWGENNMAKAINLMYCAFVKVRANGFLILDEYFLMNILLPIILKLLEPKDFFD